MQETKFVAVPVSSEHHHYIYMCVLWYAFEWALSVRLEMSSAMLLFEMHILLSLFLYRKHWKTSAMRALFCILSIYLTTISIQNSADTADIFHYCVRCNNRERSLSKVVPISTAANAAKWANNSIDFLCATISTVLKAFSLNN